MLIPPPLEIGPLDDHAVRSVHTLAHAATVADGVAPLSEQTLLSLGTDSPTLTHALARNRAGTVVGYAQIDRGGEFASAEILVHPDHRRRGTGKLLLRISTRDATLPARSGEPGDARKGLRVWAHGDLPAARAFAQAAGLTVVRELLVLERTLDGSKTGPTLPDDVELRTFDPASEDAHVWVALNAQAFADHPEQGRLTTDDVAARMAEEWFDPAGLQLLWPRSPHDPQATPRPLGYVWTKIPTGQPEASREGEIYAIGVDPGAQGRGFGRMLLDAGFAHVARQGAKRVILYVDGDNAAAMRLYNRTGFTRRSADVQYTVGG